jgi:hypothetical protein
MCNAQHSRPANYEFANWILEIMMENNITPNEEFVYELDRLIQRRREHLMRRKYDEMAMKELSKLHDLFKKHFHL